MSRKPTRVYVGSNTVQQVKPFLMRRFEIRLIAVDLRTLCGLKGVTLSSAVWDTDYTEIALGDGTITGNIAQTTLTASKAGPYWGTVLATLSDGTKVKRTWGVFVEQGFGVTGSDDPAFSIGEVEFSSPTYEVEIEDESGLITVVRNGGSSGAASVHYATSDGTATAGVDYTAVSGTLNWADGDDEPKTFVVPILSYDDGGTVILTLSDPTVVTIGDVNPALLTIPNEFTITIFDDPGTHEWNPDPRAVTTEVRVLGAGGGGGGGACESGATGITGGAGGGGGAGVVATFASGVLTGPITVTVGAGGFGGAGVSSAAGTPGTAGGVSSFGALVVAGGGGGGAQGVQSGAAARRSGGGGGGGAPNSGGTGADSAFGPGGTVGGGDGGVVGTNPTNGQSPSTVFGGGGGGAGGPGAGFLGTSSVWGGSGGGAGGAGFGGGSMQPGANGTVSSSVLVVPIGGVITTNGPILGPGDNGIDPVDPLLLAGSSGAGGGGSPSNVAGFNTGQAGPGGNGGRGSGGGGGGSSYSSNGLGGAGGTGGNGYVVIIESMI